MTSPQTDPMQEWGDEIRKYKEQKVQTGYIAKPEYITQVKHTEMKKAETSYNPILQQYTDNDIEGKLKHIEKDHMIDVLANNKVI